MRRSLAILVVSLAAASPASASASTPNAVVRVDECVRGDRPDQRSAAFEGDMRAVPGAVRLRMRFTLQARTPEDPAWTRVDAPGFRRSATSAPAVARYVYAKRVRNLPAPADYRVRVKFRWLDLAGRTIARATRTSRACRQPATL